jgi:hypothetical protein
MGRRYMSNAKANRPAVRKRRRLPINLTNGIENRPDKPGCHRVAGIQFTLFLRIGEFGLISILIEPKSILKIRVELLRHEIRVVMCQSLFLTMAIPIGIIGGINN